MDPEPRTDSQSSHMRPISPAWSDEHRAHPRIPTREHAEIGDMEGRILCLGQTLDISVGGLAVVCQEAPRLNNVYVVSFFLSRAGGAEMVTAVMKLIYCVYRDNFKDFQLGFKLLYLHN